MKTAYMHRVTQAVLAAIVIACVAPGASALWPSDAAGPLADRPGEQAQPKIAVTSDGGHYLSWFDNATGGYDVYLQKYDAAGHEVWPHNGILIADRSFSSTEDYGLDVDASDNALLAFRDDRSGTTRVTAAKISPAGTLVWGADGIQVDGGVEGVHSPRIAATTDGQVVVAWSSDGAATTVMLQKLDATGAPQWGEGVVQTPAGGYYLIADLHASDAGGVIASWQKGGPQFFNPRHLYAQKFASDGGTLWGASPVIVFDGGSLQIGNFPAFVTDAAGGAVFSWYNTSPLQCYVQHILPNGSEKFAHNGVEVSTDATRVRVSPSVAYNAATQTIFTFFSEQNSTQSQRGVYGQKIDSTGARAWGDTGKEIAPLSGDDVGFVTTVLAGEGATAYWFTEPSFANATIKAARLTAAGDFAWAEEIITIDAVPSQKGRLTAEKVTDSVTQLAWSDARSGANDIYGHRVLDNSDLWTPNVAVADKSGEQNQPKIAATSDGGGYVSWFDNAAGGYDVYLQRYDAGGNAQWPHNGLLIADRSFSSTEDYGLDVDASDNALLAFRDDRFGGTRVTAAMVDPDGTLIWGAGGVQVDNGVDTVHSPRIAATTDGQVVVAWSSDGAATTVMLQKLDSAGAPQWGAGVVQTPTSGYYLLADLHGSDAGSVIASWQKGGPQFFNPRHLYAQKFAADGTAQWGDNPLVVFDGGSLQIGNFPAFITDGRGGAVFSWYNTSPLQVHVQHVLADGAEQFPHNGAVGSTDLAGTRVSPDAAYNADTDETFLFWTEMDSIQDDRGVSGQKFDAAGNRQWGDTGIALVPIGPRDVGWVNTLRYADGALVFWLQEPSFGEATLHATRLDGQGAFVWDDPILTPATPPSSKTRLTAVLGRTGDALLTWVDARGGDNDIYAQNVLPQGALGGCAERLGDFNCDGIVDLDDYGLLAECITGPNGGLPTDCESPNFDGDNDVDLTDFAALTKAFDK